MALGKKLFLMTVSLPEGRVSKRIRPGCVGSALMLAALLCSLLEYVSSRLGRGAPMILWAVLFTRCRSFLSSVVQLENHTVQHTFYCAPVDIFEAFLWEPSAS